jgi:hypothetical protein
MILRSMNTSTRENPQIRDPEWQSGPHIPETSPSFLETLGALAYASELHARQRRHAGS